MKRRADVVGIFPNGGSIIRFIGAVLFEASDEWQTQEPYMQADPMAELMAASQAGNRKHFHRSRLKRSHFSDTQFPPR